jgi:hypothetical protein
VALAFGVTVFILGDIHDKAGDGADGGVTSCAIARAILGLLVVSLPAPSQLEAGRLTVLRLEGKSLHSSLLQVASERESCLCNEQRRDSAQRRGLEDEGGLMETAEQHKTPSIKE